MSRPKAKSRVTETGPKDEEGRPVEQGLPSLRVRRPVMFWAVVVGTAAMMLTVVSSLLLGGVGGHGGF